MKKPYEGVKLKKTRKNNKNEPYTVTSAEHISIGFSISVYYTKDINYKKNVYFCYMDEKYLDAFF